MTEPPCGHVDCPVADPEPSILRRLRTLMVDRDTDLYRGHRRRHSPTALVPGTGDSGFAPLAGTAHVYVSATRTAALLESALHHLSGADPTIYKVELTGWAVAPVRLVQALRLIDLRNPELERLGLHRAQLVDTDPLHYPCTRRWAAALQHRKVGGHQAAGILWHSRQADLHARAQPRGVLGDLLTHRNIEVAVLWHPHGPNAPLASEGDSEPLIDGGDPSQLVRELAALLAAPIE